MKILKNAALCALIVAFAVCVCGCDASASLSADSAGRPSASSASGETPADFDAFLEQTLIDVVNEDSATLYMSFEHPEALGIEGTASDLGSPSKEEWADIVAESDATLARAEAVDESALDPEDARTYEILLDALRRDNQLADFYYHICSPLGVDGGAASLGTLVAHLPYADREGFERVLTLYEGLRAQFEEMVALEKERQELGYGLSQAEIDMSIEEMEKLIDGDPPAAATLMDEAIDRADFLDETEKADLKRRNAEAVRTYLVPAYEYLIGEMRSLNGREGSIGTASAPQGKEYYAARLRAMGFDETPEELLSYLKEQYDLCLSEMSELVRLADPDVLQDVLYGSGDPYTDASSPGEVVAYIQESMAGEFPSVGDFDYEVVETPEALKAPGVAAYYVLRPLDATPDEASAIFINMDGEEAPYSTLAHEGFPGHMYQDAYEQTLNRPYALRYLESAYLASAEGWGVYAQIVAADYATKDPVVARILALDDLIGRIFYAYADIGVNYLGWDREEMVSQLERNLNLDDMGEIYEMIAVRSGQWVPYAAGALRLLDMREKAENALGEDFSATDFHRAVLDVLPASMSALEQATDEYVEAVRNAPKLDSPLQAA